MRTTPLLLLIALASPALAQDPPDENGTPDTAPAEDAAPAAEDAPTEEAPAEEDASGEDAPAAEDAPAEESPAAEDAPAAEDTPAEGEPTEESPAAEDAPTDGDAPTEDAPGEEDPAAEDDTGAPAPEPYTGDVPIEELPILEGPQIAEYVEAPYPPEAEEQELEATVVLLIEIDETGTVTYVEVLGPAGNGFDEAAKAAAEKMRFTPAMTEAGPVPVAFEFAYGFKLSPEDEADTEGGTGEDGPEEVEAPPPPVNVEGILREMGTRNPVPGALVTIDGTDIEAETNEEGRFELRGVPVGEQPLRALKPGYTILDTEVEVEEGLVTSATFWIRAESYRDNEAVAIYQREQTEVTRRTITIEEIKRVPGTFGDPLKVVQTLPGAARSPFGTGLLVIRGSNPEDSGVYVDGIRIPIIYHLTGTTSVLSPDLIESVDYLPGSFGVQYGRSMGGVIDVTTKSEFSEDGKIVWGTDILDTQLYYEGQIGKEGKKHGLAIGARRSYIDAFIPIFTQGSDFTIKPRYWDYQLKWVPHLEGNRSASVFVYGFNDLLEIRTPDDVAQGSDQDTQGGLRTEYMSHRVVANYTDQITPKTRIEITPSIGYDYTNFGLGDEFTLKSDNWLIELRAQTPIAFSDQVELVPGLDFIGGPWGFDFRSPFSFTDIDDPLSEREPVGFDGRGTGWSADPFVKVNLRPLEDPEKLLITPGLRYNTFLLTYGGSITGNDDGAGTTYFSDAWDPRILGRWQVSENVALKGATGLYTQPAQPFEAIGIGTTSELGYESAWNSSVGLEQNLSQAVKWELELYYKQMDKLIVFDESFTGAGMQTFVNGGSGRAYGAEVILRHEPVNRLFGWVSYTLSRSIRHDGPDADWKPFNKDNLNNGWYPFDFDQTHILSAQGGYDLPKDFGISAQIQYVTGNPDYPSDAGVYDADGDFYNGFSTGTQTRLPPFFQTSLRFDKLFTFKRWQMETYVDLLNAVRGVNPEFTTYSYDYSEYAYVRGLPFIPNIGLEAKFYL